MRLGKPLLLVLALLLPAPTLAANVCDPDTGTDCAKVNAEGALHVTYGKDTRATYVLSAISQANTAAAPALSLEAEAGRGFKIVRVCIDPGSATGAAWTSWQLMRTTTASSGGTTATQEGTGNVAVSKMDPADSNWSGAARAGGTGGTSGAVIDGGMVFANITATPPTMNAEVCRVYCVDGAKCPTIVAGTTNGVKIQFTGTAGGASQAFKILFVAD